MAPDSLFRIRTRTFHRQTLPPVLQDQPEDAIDNRTLAQVVSEQVEADRWTTIAQRYVGLYDPDDLVGSGIRAGMFIRALAGSDNARYNRICRHITEEMRRDPDLYQLRYPDEHIDNMNPPPPFAAYPTEGEVTVEMSPEVTLPEYFILPPCPPSYTEFRGNHKELWSEDNDDRKAAFVVVEQEMFIEGIGVLDLICVALVLTCGMLVTYLMFYR